MHLQEPETFWFTSDAFCKRPILLKYWLLCPFFTRKSQAKALPRKDYFCTWGVPQRVPSSVSSRILCSDVLLWAGISRTPKIHGASRPLGTTIAWRYDIPRDWLWDVCHLTRVHWGTHCEGFCSKEVPHYCFEQSVRKPVERDQGKRALGNHPEALIGQATINLYSRVWKSLENSLPGLYQWLYCAT